MSNIHRTGLLVLCVAMLACNKHNAQTTAPTAAAATAEPAVETATMAADARAKEAEAQTKETDARIKEAQAVQVPAPSTKPQTASASPSSPVGMGPRPAGTVPGSNVKPGRVKATKPSQGTIQPQSATTPPSNGTASGAGAAGTAAAGTGAAAAAKTKGDAEHGSSKNDRRMTQHIRRALMEDDSLSFTAKNVQIVTRHGQVTLRGLVLNEKEREEIEQLARDHVGDGTVTNLLEVERR